MALPSPTNPRPTTPREKRPARTALVLAVVLLLAAAALLTQRGLLRGAAGSWDLTMVYAGAHQFVAADNPYDFDAMFDAYEAAGGTDKARDPRVFASLYPPMTYAVLAPLGRLDWPQARLAWLLINLAAAAAVATWLIRHGRRPSAETAAKDHGRPGGWAGTAGLVAVTLWLGSATLHTTLAFGQLSVVTLALMLPLLGPPRSDGEPEGWPWLSVRTAGFGLLLAVAGALKPQLMVIVAGLLLLTPRWRAVVWGMAGGLVITAVSVAWLQHAAPTWLADWQSQLAFFAAGGHANPTADNPLTYQMIHLEPWLHRLWPSGTGPLTLLKWLPIGIVAVVGGAAAVLLKRSGSAAPRTPETDTTPTPGNSHTNAANPHQRNDFFLLAMSLGVVLTLLVGYHRTYDAVLLVVPGLWVWRRLSDRPRSWSAWTALAVIVLFTFPGPVALTVAERRGTLPGWLTDSYAWQAVLLPHHTVALVVLLLVMLNVARHHPAIRRGEHVVRRPLRRPQPTPNPKESVREVVA